MTTYIEEFYGDKSAAGAVIGYEDQDIPGIARLRSPDHLLGHCSREADLAGERFNAGTTLATCYVYEARISVKQH